MVKGKSEQMNQQERRQFLIQRLLKEQKEFKKVLIPKETTQQKQLLRSLMNIRLPQAIDEEFAVIQDEYLQAELEEKGITDLKDLEPIEKDLYLWQGDITTLRCDAIVNAANSGLTGCYVPCHRCIDNCIHTYAGIQLRNQCAKIMQKQGSPEKIGQAKITPAYNLPCQFIIHTVGPIIRDQVTNEDIAMLRSSYLSCLQLAEQNGISSLAFCCISTGEFHFPNLLAAKIAVETVREYKRDFHSHMEVIFNVFKEIDYEIYRELLGKDKQD